MRPTVKSFAFISDVKNCHSLTSLSVSRGSAARKTRNANWPPALGKCFKTKRGALAEPAGRSPAPGDSAALRRMHAPF